MNRKLPYEEEFAGRMDELPLPDEDLSWKKMRELLDKEKDRKPIGYWRWWAAGVLLLLLAGYGIYLFTVVDQFPATSRTLQTGGNNAPKHSSKRSSNRPEVNKTANDLDHDAAAPSHSKAHSNSSSSAGKGNNAIVPQDPSSGPRLLIRRTRHTAESIQHSRQRGTSMRYSEGRNSAGSDPLRNDNAIRQEGPVEKIAEKYDPVQQPSTLNIKAAPAKTGEGDKSDSLSTLKQADTLAPKQTAVDSASTPIVIQTTRGGLHWSAGIGVQQALSLGGQKSINYGYNAGSTLSDYIPSLWLRLEKKNRFFFQGEFIYSAPQLIKEFAYSRFTQADSARTTVTTTRLKKTFFNQVPVSFNYYLTKQWSLGAGAAFNWLKGSISEIETNAKNTQGGQSTVRKEIVPVNGFKDSFLYRSHTMFILQTEYRINRISGGLKYTRDLQPFMTYTLPDGAIIDERNWALSLFFKLRLWKD